MNIPSHLSIAEIVARLPTVGVLGAGSRSRPLFSEALRIALRDGTIPDDLDDLGQNVIAYTLYRYVTCQALV